LEKHNSGTAVNEKSQLMCRKQSVRLISFKFNDVVCKYISVPFFAETSTTVSSDQMSEVVFGGFDFVHVNITA